MILDGSKGWYWYLKSLPEKVREHDATVRFHIIEREIGDRFCAKSMMVDESAIAYNIWDEDTLFGILFDESIKSKCIAAMEDKWSPMAVLDITIVLVQGGEGYTNIDADVLDSFSKVFQQQSINISQPH